MSQPSTTPIDPTLSWEEYCVEIGVDPSAARSASVPRALCVMIGGRVPTIDAEPGEEGSDGPAA